MTPFYEAATEIASLARATDEIEINTKGAAIELNSDEARLLRAFTRLHDGICADIAVLSGGLSGARVIQADIKDEKGGIRLSVASKLGRYSAISDEISRYEREVVRLRNGTYATLIPAQIVQVGSSKSAFYRLLDGYDQSLFSVLQKSDDGAIACVNAIRNG